jgi:hypothetical protein
MTNMKLPTQAELDQQALQQQIEAMRQQALAPQEQQAPPMGGIPQGQMALQ